MGLFGTNWEKRLERAQELLRRDLPIDALEIAERAARKVTPELRPRAEALLASARKAALAAVLSNAERAEAAGDFEDAADWLLSAMEHEPDAAARAGHEMRRKALLERGRGGGDSRHAGGLIERRTITVEAREASTDVSFRYDTLISMLSDEVGDRYENRFAAFQLAFVQLNEGDVESALPVLAELAAAAPKDPVLRFELGRARMLSGDPAAASDDLAVAWEGLGDGPLDRGESLFAPALWAEAALAAGDEREVADRLEPLAGPSAAYPEISGLYATALLATGRAEEALVHLRATIARFPNDSELSLLTARALAATGDAARALAGLEQAIAPSCATGGCARPEPHLASFRFLAGLHLEHGPEQGGDPERARELVARIADARQGRLEPEELELLAAYYRATGDPEAADEAAAEARRLAAAGQAPDEIRGVAPQTERIL